MLPKTYIIQDSGQVTLPAEFRKKYNLNKGDEITFIETDEGLLISPRAALLKRLLDELASDLDAQGVTLEELMSTGRAERSDLLRKLYGLKDGT